MKTYTAAEARHLMERYCAYQERSYSEVEKKLITMRLIPELREQIMTHLITENYINEARYAQAFAGGKFRIKKWGRIKIQLALKQKGVSPANIQTGLAVIDEKEYLDTLYQVCIKWIQSHGNPEVELPDKTTDFKSFIQENTSFEARQKMLKYLQSRGYELDLVFKYIIP